MSIPTAVIRAAKVMGLPLAKKLLSQTNKGFSKFFDNAVVQGYSLDQAMDYLIGRFANPASEATQTNLQSREAQGQARPDELAALQDIQNSRTVPNAIHKGIAFGAPVAFGARENALEKRSAQAQAQEQEAAEQQQNQQKEALEAYQRERQEEIDRERRTKQQHEQSSRVKKETMAAERHRMQMEKGKTKLATAPKAPPLSKASRLGKPPEDFIDALRQMDELINRFP